MIQKNTVWFDVYNSTGNDDEAWRELRRSEPEFRFSYHRIDGWRGYMEAKATKKSGWKKVDDDKFPGWVTGEWDDAPEGTRGSELEAALQELDATEIKVIFMPTSNVFSTAYDIFVR